MSGANDAATWRNVVLKIFSKKHSLSLTPQSLGFLLNVAQTYSLNATNLASIADSLALAYLKQDDCSPIVDADVLQKVYLNLQLNYAGGMSTLDGDNDDYINEDEIDPRNYLKIVDSFDIPRYAYAVNNKSFVRQHSQSVAGQPSSLSQLWLDRYNIIKQIILRNEFFSPPSTINSHSHDRDNYMKITSTKNLLGRHGHRFMLFGMLSQTTDGRHALQDPDGVVVLDLTEAVGVRAYTLLFLTQRRSQAKVSSLKAHSYSSMASTSLKQTSLCSRCTASVTRHPRSARRRSLCTATSTFSALEAYR